MVRSYPDGATPSNTQGSIQKRTLTIGHDAGFKQARQPERRRDGLLFVCEKPFATVFIIIKLLFNTNSKLLLYSIFNNIYYSLRLTGSHEGYI